MDGLILAIDLGEFNSVCCRYVTTTKSATFRHAKTTVADLLLSPLSRICGREARE
jgi:hypothetical protein